MHRFPTWLPRGARLAVLDVVLAIWVAAWILVGISLAGDVRGVASLSETVTQVGQAIQDVGNTLGLLGNVPLIGGEVAEPAARIAEIGENAARNGRRSQESAGDVSTLLGVAIALIPSLPILGFYLPARISHVREARALRMTLGRHRDDPGLSELLARRALLHASYRDLARLGDPIADLRAGRYEPLVETELERLGLQAAWLRGSASETRPR